MNDTDGFNAGPGKLNKTTMFGVDGGQEEGNILLPKCSEVPQTHTLRNTKFAVVLNSLKRLQQSAWVLSIGW